MNKTRIKPFHTRVFTLEGSQYWRTGPDVAPDDQGSLDDWLAEDLEAGYALHSMVQMDQDGNRVRVTTQRQPDRASTTSSAPPAQGREGREPVIPTTGKPGISDRYPRPYPGREEHRWKLPN